MNLPVHVMNENSPLVTKNIINNDEKNIDSKTYSYFKKLIFIITGIIICVFVFHVNKPNDALVEIKNSSTLLLREVPTKLKIDSSTNDDSKEDYISDKSYDVINDTNFSIKDNSNSYILASGRFIKKKNGWNFFTIEVPDILLPTTNKESIESQEIYDLYFQSMEGMGYIEGFATCEDINEYYVNFYSGLFDGGDPTKESINFLIDNYNWMKQQSDNQWETSEYWFNIRGLLYQINGMVNGIQKGCPGSHSDDSEADVFKYLKSMRKKPDLIHLLLLNANGDMYQIGAKYDQASSETSVDDDDSTSLEDKDPSIIVKSNRLRRKTLFKPSRKLVDRTDPTNGGSRESGVDHCSAIIKILDNYEDIVFGHNTWDDFQNAAPRLFKHYSYPIMHKPMANTIEDVANIKQESKDKSLTRYDVTFSSSPGFLTSVDDFFISKGRANLFITETTLDLYDNTILEMVHPESVLSWARSRIANSVASSGVEWVEIFSMFHSGTYDNQWMVIDSDLFIKGEVPPPNFLTILEEIPGYVHSADVTDVLIAQGYWASYNNPYFKDIADFSGNTNLCEVNDKFCYEGDPRAKIFKKLADSIIDISSLKLVMGYNQFQSDPLSLGNPCNAISCRNDLQPNKTISYPFGAIDAKISSVNLMLQDPPIIHTRLGPTNDDQIPFCWSDTSGHNHRGRPFTHLGHPDCFDNKWEIMPIQ